MAGPARQIQDITLETEGLRLTRVGRRASVNDVVLQDVRVSGRHAILGHAGGDAFQVVDTYSSNGVYVEDHQRPGRWVRIPVSGQGVFCLYGDLVRLGPRADSPCLRVWPGPEIACSGGA